MSSSCTHILNTRPCGQHLPFTRSLVALGFTVSHLPCLAITGLPGHPLKKDSAAQVDIVLFTSVNAVHFAHSQQPFPWKNVAVHAIGAATATALQALRQPMAMQPIPPFNSETYLTQLAQLQPARLLLIKGEGGRGLIARQLRTMGWQVTELNLYRRELPDIDVAVLENIFGHATPDIISITSNESLDNLVILANEFLPVLLNIPLVVNSQRAAERAMESGFTNTPMVASPPGDEGQINAIRQWVEKP